MRDAAALTEEEAEGKDESVPKEEALGLALIELGSESDSEGESEACALRVPGARIPEAVAARTEGDVDALPLALLPLEWEDAAESEFEALFVVELLGVFEGDEVEDCEALGHIEAEARAVPEKGTDAVAKE